jgi:glycosyltransferase involved in cell wall biosynthesis
MISLICPARNNLKYLKWSYNSIRKNAPANVQICVADDFSTDGTWDWCVDTMNADPNFKAIRNAGPTRLGHTILYDRLINEVATNDVIGIWHCDMYMTPGTIEKILGELNNELSKIVSLTRIEPPLHPPGPEKIIKDFGTEPEYFDENIFLEWYSKLIISTKDQTSNGIFAPWFMYKFTFQSIGGHDPLYAPQSKEDSDIFNRFKLAGCNFVQLWDAAIYHMTCRGSRFNPTITTVGSNSKEWEEQNIRSTRNFIRKWGHFVRHDENLNPIIPHKYNIHAIIHNCTEYHLELLEPWFSHVYVETDIPEMVYNYFNREQPNTKFNLEKRVSLFNKETFSTDNIDILIEFDATKLTNESFNIIQNLSDIITDSGEIGEFDLDIFKIAITNMRTYENELIICNTK